jgi:hypothetical protein
MAARGKARIGPYRDEVHAETPEGLQVGEYGYKYRLVDGLVMPPYITPKRYRLSRTIQTRPGDICYTSYPKSGSTWLAYILVLLVNDGEAPQGRTLRDCLHWVESSYTYPREEDELRALPSPRIFKSHMPYQMAFGGDPATCPCRYVYIARNPKDVAVSYYFFEYGKSWSGGYSGPWEQWLELFMTGRVQRGDWFDHVLGWWERRNFENILFLRYEDLCRDFAGEVERLGRFLDHPLSPALLDKIARKTGFDEMVGTEFSNMHEIEEFGEFFRKGSVGSWKEQFTPSQSDAFDELYRRRMAGSGLDFDFD